MHAYEYMLSFLNCPSLVYCCLHLFTKLPFKKLKNLLLVMFSSFIVIMNKVCGSPRAGHLLLRSLTMSMKKLKNTKL